MLKIFDEEVISLGDGCGCGCLCECFNCNDLVLEAIDHQASWDCAYEGVKTEVM